MKKIKKVKNITSVKGPRDIEEGYFEPLQVKVYGNFDRAFKTFRSMVQAEKILADYKARQRYEKPSEKKRRKQSEAAQHRLEEDTKQQKIISGEYEKEKIRKQAKKEKKMQERAERTKTTEA